MAIDNSGHKGLILARMKQHPKPANLMIGDLNERSPSQNREPSKSRKTGIRPRESQASIKTPKSLVVTVAPD